MSVGATSCHFAPAFVVEGKDGRYSIFAESPIATPVVVEVGWFEVQRTDLRPPTRLKVLTNVTSNKHEPTAFFLNSWWSYLVGNCGR